MNDKDLLHDTNPTSSNNFSNDGSSLLQEQSSLINNISTSKSDDVVKKEDVRYSEAYEKQSQQHMDNVREALAAARLRGDYGTRIEIDGTPITQDMTYLTTPAKLPEEVKKQLDEDGNGNVNHALR